MKFSLTLKRVQWKREIPGNPNAFFPQLCTSNYSKTLWISMNLNIEQWCFNILAPCHQASWSMVYRNCRWQRTADQKLSAVENPSQSEFTWLSFISLPRCYFYSPPLTSFLAFSNLPSFLLLLLKLHSVSCLHTHTDTQIVSQNCHEGCRGHELKVFFCLFWELLLTQQYRVHS